MHVIVLGAGVVGVTTAHYLAARGCEVTVVDRCASVAAGASHANGGQLSYSFTDSLAKPGFIRQIPALLSGRDPGSRIRLAAGLFGWGTRFLAQCTTQRARRNTLSLLTTALRSAELMADLRLQLPFSFSYRPAGKLVLLANSGELRAARQATRLKAEHGCDVELLGRTEALALEPTLAGMNTQFDAAVYSRRDEVADAREFSAGMRRYLEGSGRVTFRLSTNVKEIVCSDGRGGRVSGVRCDELFEADAVVVCLGAWSTALLRPVGIKTHIYPVRGYSVTMPPGASAPSVSVTSLAHRLVLSRLNGSTRIAGFADFAGFETRRDSQRIQRLVDTARRIAPGAADFAAGNREPWGGFRPMTPSGRPYVGPSKIPGLFLNTGHGMLGWTLACATADDTAKAVVRAH